MPKKHRPVRFTGNRWVLPVIILIAIAALLLMPFAFSAPSPTPTLPAGNTEPAIEIPANWIKELSGVSVGDTFFAHDIQRGITWKFQVTSTNTPFFELPVTLTIGRDGPANEFAVFNGDGTTLFRIYDSGNSLTITGINYVLLSQEIP